MSSSGPATFQPGKLSLPPVYRGVTSVPPDDPFEAACGLAGRPDTDASFVWSLRTDAADCAVVLAPDRPLAEALLVLYVAMNGLADALGAVVPPEVAVTFGWPDRIDINGAEAGVFRVAYAKPDSEDAIPDWMVVGLSLLITPDPGDDAPGNRPNHTTLFDEGCGDLEAASILESFGRHFLYWINRWEEDGFGAVLASWLPRATGRTETAYFGYGENRLEGTAVSVDPKGGLIVDIGSGHETLPLAPALASVDRRDR